MIYYPYLFPQGLIGNNPPDYEYATFDLKPGHIDSLYVIQPVPVRPGSRS